MRLADTRKSRATWLEGIIEMGSKQRPYQFFRIARVLYFHVIDARTNNRIIVPAGENGITYEKHLLDWNTQFFPDLTNAICLVNSFSRYIDCRKAAAPDFEGFKPLTQEFYHFLADTFVIFAIPLFFRG